MEGEQRRRQIEEEMARFEQEILQLQRNLAASVAGLRPPPMPPMMMPPKPPPLMSTKPPSQTHPPHIIPPDPSILMGPTESSMMGMPPPPPEQLMMGMPPMGMAPKPPMMGMPPRPPSMMVQSRGRPPSHQQHQQHAMYMSMRPSQLSPTPELAGPPPNDAKPAVTVYSAPPKKAADLEADEILAALQKAEAELREAKNNSSLTNEKANSGAVSHPVAQSSHKGGQIVSSPGSVTTAHGNVVGSTSAAASTGPQLVPAGNGGEEGPRKKGKKVIRMAGQQVWEDSSLSDWDPDDFRIFCGDLGNDVTDDMLTRVFSKYPTFVRAKVIRDKRTNKSKGYGFVSFKEPQGFIKAMRELNGKYVGSRPIKLRKSTWNERNIDVVKKKIKDKQKLGLL
ncbi:hypothetical protein BIW11_02727 [Tropilaelaps mercedesae]|uniref:RNA-binding protein 42 n=1 Tax=Tropilaelaps mercedesae TaxID=418985 RepID=A0A1V9XYG6_9ACAR|nr:hypothetical protein BIW11_02727 [Tropilaelaps mercedesae]